MSERVDVHIFMNNVFWFIDGCLKMVQQQQKKQEEEEELKKVMWVDVLIRRVRDEVT